MKQKKISRWLNGLSLVIAILGMIAFAAITVAKVSIYQFEPKPLLIGSLVFTWISATLCYAILYQFFKVSIQIGKDNSFSIENAYAFHKMSIFAAIFGVFYIIRGIFISFFAEEILLIWIFCTLMFMAGGTLTILCEALSKLIMNAYEVKQENDFTI